MTATSAPAVSQLIADEEAERLERALEALGPEAHREVIVLRKFEELSFAEIGGAHGPQRGRVPHAARPGDGRADVELRAGQ